MIIGSFVFRDDGDGCLASKYINVVSTTPFVESCKRQPPERPTRPAIDPYDGTFTSGWIEGTGVSPATLSITPQGDYYLLEWMDTGGTIRFKGQGMVYHGDLVGSYWDVDVEPMLTPLPDYVFNNIRPVLRNPTQTE